MHLQREDAEMLEGVRILPQSPRRRQPLGGCHRGHEVLSEGPVIMIIGDWMGDSLLLPKRISWSRESCYLMSPCFLSPFRKAFRYWSFSSSQYRLAGMPSLPGR